MSVKKSLIIIIPVAVIIIISIVYKAYDSHMEYINNHRLVNKTLSIVIEQDEVVDYKAVKNGEHNLSLWNNWAKNKMIRYMKHNNYKISSGSYEIKQGTFFKDALGVFKFEKIE